MLCSSYGKSPENQQDDLCPQLAMVVTCVILGWVGVTGEVSGSHWV